MVLSDAPSITIDFRPMVSGGNLKNPVAIKACQQVDGFMFFKVSLRDKTIVRLLTGASHSRQLSRISIFDDLLKAREAKIDEYMVAKPQEDLGFDDEPDNRRIKRRRTAESASLVPQWGRIAACISVRIVC